jgi:hypothetical protein
MIVNGYRKTVRRVLEFRVDDDDSVEYKDVY